MRNTKRYLWILLCLTVFLSILIINVHAQDDEISSGSSGFTNSEENNETLKKMLLEEFLKSRGKQDLISDPDALQRLRSTHLGAPAPLSVQNLNSNSTTKTTTRTVNSMKMEIISPDPITSGDSITVTITAPAEGVIAVLPFFAFTVTPTEYTITGNSPEAPGDNFVVTGMTTSENHTNTFANGIFFPHGSEIGYPWQNLPGGLESCSFITMSDNVPWKMRRFIYAFWGDKITWVFSNIQIPEPADYTFSLVVNGMWYNSAVVGYGWLGIAMANIPYMGENYHGTPYSFSHTVPGVPALAAPTNLVATTASSSQIDISWTDNADNEEGFKIESKVNCFGDFIQIATVDANITSYSDRRALASIEHSYRVRAYNEAGDSDYSNIASAIPSKPMDDITSALNQSYQEGEIRNQGLYNSLLSKLASAQNAQNTNAALGQLQAFSNHVQAQAGNGISIETSQSLLAYNDTLMAYTNQEKTASGTSLIAVLEPLNWENVRIEALTTPTPYEPEGPGDNRGATGTTTPGVLNLYYTDGAGQCVNISRTININNVTREISYNGIPVTTLGDIFGQITASYIAPTGDYMFLLMDFPYWLSMLIDPGILFQTQSAMPRFNTDENRVIRIIPGGLPITPPTTATVDIWLRSLGLTPTITSRPGVITPTAITPTYAYNCHGWTFSCTRGWLNDPGDIITDNGYTPVTSTNWVHVGALVIYRNITGTALHTAIVREVIKDGIKSTTYCNYGTPTLLESKWGELGRYKHPPRRVLNIYIPLGGSITYFQPPNRQPPVNTGDSGKDQHTLTRE